MGIIEPWDSNSWAPILDAATSVGSTVFEEPRLRMPAHIERLEMLTEDSPPRNFWLHVQRASGTSCHVTVLDFEGTVMAKAASMRFAEIEGAPGVSGSMESLVHQVAWLLAEPSKQALTFTQLILISGDGDLAAEYACTVLNDVNTLILASPKDLVADSTNIPLTRETAIVYLPRHVHKVEDIPETSKLFTWELLEIVKLVVRSRLPVSVFVVTHNTGEGADPTALAHAPLIGLSRVLSSEHPEAFAGLIDSDERRIPIGIMHQIQGADIIRLRSGTPRTARLRNLPRDRLLPSARASRLLPHSQGTYLITGGFGTLGLEVAAFLVEKGARRLVLVSRRCLPSRKLWSQASPDMRPIIARIQSLEAHGASVHVLALDISLPTAAEDLSDALDRLSLPRVLGVVHAAGTLDNQLAMDTTSDAFARVLAPKVNGGLALNQVFPAQSVDFFILFSSCGQLLGFPGQSSYASANAFLDSLATYRRVRGDCAVSFQWTSWREMGMGGDSEFVQAELETKGVTEVTGDEAFAAWMHLSKYDVDHGVVLRTVVLDEEEPIPAPILGDIAVRRGSRAVGKGEIDASHDREEMMPQSAAELKMFVEQKIRGCVSCILHTSADDVDSREALSDMGVDSVMTVRLRRQLQLALKVKVPPTLTWSHPTVSHLVGWFTDKLVSNGVAALCSKSQ